MKIEILPSSAIFPILMSEVGRISKDVAHAAVGDKAEQSCDMVCSAAATVDNTHLRDG